MKRIFGGKRRAAQILTAAVCLSASVVLSTTQAEARLLAVDLAPATETDHTAIHLPTGCVAVVTLDQRVFISAAITDPDCLPKGVATRPVPGTRMDFRLVDLNVF